MAYHTTTKSKVTDMIFNWSLFILSNLSDFNLAKVRFHLRNTLLCHTFGEQPEVNSWTDWIDKKYLVTPEHIFFSIFL